MDTMSPRRGSSLLMATLTVLTSSEVLPDETPHKQGEKSDFPTRWPGQDATSTSACTLSLGGLLPLLLLVSAADTRFGKEGDQQGWVG